MAYLVTRYYKIHFVIVAKIQKYQPIILRIIVLSKKGKQHDVSRLKLISSYFISNFVRFRNQNFHIDCFNSNYSKKLDGIGLFRYLTHAYFIIYRKYFIMIS